MMRLQLLLPLRTQINKMMRLQLPSVIQLVLLLLLAFVQSSSVRGWILPSNQPLPSHRHRRVKEVIRRHGTRLSDPPEEWQDGLPPEKHQLFLKKFWQKKPLLIRKAFDPSFAIVGPSELLGLAIDEAVTSRLVEKVDGEWFLRQGPFDEEDFLDEEDASISGRKWTVLVQEVDRHVPEVSDLLNSFRFIPNWRVDDIMISYAPKEGGIGPHVDNYDVFLLQGRGLRQWSIQHELLGVQEERDDLIEGSPVRILKNFKADISWTLEPGDMLYLPPRVPHDGVSLNGECMTYSIGFRAPSQRDLITAAASAAKEHLSSEQGLFYTDPALELQTKCGEITPASIHRMREMVRESLTKVLNDDAIVATWIGAHVTSPKRSRSAEEEEDHSPPLWTANWSSGEEEEEVPTAQHVLQAIKKGEHIEIFRAEGTKFAYAMISGGTLLFVDGKVWKVEEDPRALEISPAFSACSLCSCLTQDSQICVTTLNRFMEVESSGQAGEASGRVEKLLVDLMNHDYLYPVKGEHLLMGG